MKIYRWAAVLSLALLTGCGHTSSSPAVPSITAPASAVAVGSDRAAAVHAAAQCIRAHGVPSYQEPIVTANGAVFSDSRSIQNAPQSAQAAVQSACSTLLAQAGFNPEDEPPAPPALVQAGVKAAQCFRAHGLPNVKDPTAQSPYTPGHGFGLSGDEVPAGGKAAPGFQEAIQACHVQDDAEIQASTLANLSK
jgi:hypothetical protein